MQRHILSAVIVSACAALVPANIIPIYTSTPGAPVVTASIGLGPHGDIVFVAGTDYYVKRHLSNVKYNEFTIPVGPGTPSQPNISPDGTISSIVVGASTLQIKVLADDSSATSAPLTQNGSPIDPSSFQTLPTNGSSRGLPHVSVRQAPYSSIIISTRLDGTTTDITPVDGDFIGLSTNGPNIGYAYASPGGGMPHVKIVSDDLSQSNQIDLPQFTSVGTPVFGGDSVFFVATTPGTSGSSPVLSVQQNPLYQPSGTEHTNPLYTGSNRTISIDTPAANDADGIAFVLTDTDINGIEQKHIIHRDLATRDFLTDLSTGDPLNGSTITDLYLSPNSLADNGDLLFYATLADGSSGLFLTSVPEPASLLAACALCFPLLTRRRQQNL